MIVELHGNNFGKNNSMKLENRLSSIKIISSSIFRQIVSSSKQFAIVRDPFTRFASAAHCMIKEWYSDMEDEIYSNLESKEGLWQFIEYHAITKRYNANWMRLQHEFISNKTLVYRYEDGLGKNFIDWFNQSFDETIDHKEYSYFGDPKELLENKIKENKKIESNVRLYYKDDYERLNY